MNRRGSIVAAALSVLLVFGCRAHAQAESSGLSMADLEEMLAPIALYPDPLLANMLAASIYPDEVAAAAAFVGRGKPTEEQIEAKGWEPSVAAVAMVPDALKMMGDYPDWTVGLGQAYLAQSQDVMTAVQNLRKRAWDNGALRTTEQQVVTNTGGTVVIQPANPQIIYVPVYQPSVVYVSQPPSNAVAAGLIGFGLGVAVGAILSDVDCNWHGGFVCWGGGWGYYGGGYHGGYYNKQSVKIDNSRNINIDGDVNIGSGNNNGRPRPGQEGGAWTPNKDKARPRDASATNKFRGAGSQPGANSGARIPGRQPGAQPIASRPAPSPSTRPSVPSSRPTGTAAGAGARPTAPARPTGVPTTRPAGPSSTNRPAIPPSSRQPSAGNSSRPSGASGNRPSGSGARPSTTQPRPSGASRPSGYGGGVDRKAASNRGKSSRSGGGGARRGGRR